MNEIDFARKGESDQDSAVRESDDGTCEEYQIRSSSVYTYYREIDYEAHETSERVAEQRSCSRTKFCSDIGWLKEFDK